MDPIIVTGLNGRPVEIDRNNPLWKSARKLCSGANLSDPSHYHYVRGQVELLCAAYGLSAADSGGIVEAELIKPPAMPAFEMRRVTADGGEVIVCGNETGGVTLTISGGGTKETAHTATVALSHENAQDLVGGFQRALSHMHAALRVALDLAMTRWPEVDLNVLAERADAAE